jgi:hypothetical protein
MAYAATIEAGRAFVVLRELYVWLPIWLGMRLKIEEVQRPSLQFRFLFPVSQSTSDAEVFISFCRSC